ncbi:hypothetical protein BT63DRAFT_410151 [Microthyrium microscopicum]|uniref:C2H2-type domain-containing protein n=1 Tax=Microthyrium microscopicum TaxID=703497 RepID=A0A6A6UQA8_9PEZI|nr:hypothetical protein BT63DRAFT_410151 [Microthyrium microscopicum]
MEHEQFRSGFVNPAFLSLDHTPVEEHFHLPQPECTCGQGACPKCSSFLVSPTSPLNSVHSRPYSQTLDAPQSEYGQPSSFGGSPSPTQIASYGGNVQQAFSASFAEGHENAQSTAYGTGYHSGQSTFKDAFENMQIDTYGVGSEYAQTSTFGVHFEHIQPTPLDSFSKTPLLRTPTIIGPALPGPSGYNAVQTQAFDGPWSMHHVGDNTDESMPPGFQVELTPDSATPSMFDEELDMRLPLSVNDFTGRDRPGLRLEYQTERFEEANHLVQSINTDGYRIHGTGDNDLLGGAIKALQKTLSFNLSVNLSADKVAPTTQQLDHELQSHRVRNKTQNNVTVTANELDHVLQSYCLRNGLCFQLGVVSKASDPGTYISTIHTSLSPQSVSTLWLYYDESGEDTGFPHRWAAIIPYENSRQPSYKEALLAQPRPVSAPGQPSNPTGIINRSMLHAPHPIPAGRVNRRRTPSISGHSHVSGPGRRRGAARSRAPSEAGVSHDRSHRCTECDKTFLYPKDLRRHLTTHSGHKNFNCAYCIKSFTRKDNMNRHVRDDHAGATPAASTNRSS